ncbi:unnamed protein product [Mortierella alpina]
MSLSPIAIIFIVSGGVVSFTFAFCYRRRLKRTENSSNFRIHRSIVRAPDQYLFSAHPSEAQQQQRTGKAATYIHPALSSHSLHMDTKLSDEEEDNDDSSFRNSNPPLLGVITSQSYTRARSPSPMGLHPVARDIELASLLPVHHSSSSSSRRKELARLQTNPASSSTTQLEVLPAVEDGIDRRVDGYFQKSSLPRPLGLQRPVLADTSITSSSRVVANIIRPVPTDETSQEKAEIEPIVVYVQKRSSLRNAPSTQSPTARGESLQHSRTRAASISRTQQHGRASPLHRTGSADAASGTEGPDPSKAKEEVHRQAPHALLTDNRPASPHASLASQTAVVDMSSERDTDESDEEENRRSMNTAILMLQPYMSASDQSLPLPSVPTTRRAPAECTLSSLPAPPSPSMTSPSAPTRPPRRVPSITRKQRRQMQASPPAEEPPKPLSSILELPTPPTTSHVTVPPTPPSRTDSTPAPPRAASPFSFPSGRSFPQSILDRGSFSTHSGSGSASGSVSGSGSERAISPVPSNASSGHSSNLSTVLSNASMASFATSSPGTSVVSTMESPALSPTMSLASPTAASMHSPVTPHTARTFSSRNYNKNRSMDDLVSREELNKAYHHNNANSGNSTKDQGGKEQVKGSSREILQPAWLHNPPLPGSALGRKRVNDPHLGTAGARLSEFSYGS